jgi:hypothetical protein
MLFRSLAYFRDCEDAVRGDEYEGTSRFLPDSGLLITNQTQRTQFTLAEYAFESTVKANEIFVFLHKSLTGHNFIGSPSFWFVISGSSVTNLVINLECPVDCVSVGMLPLAVSGTTLSGSYSGTLPDGTPVAVALQAQENVADDTLTGTVTFSQPPCGTAQNPWVGGFTVKPAQ